MNVVYDSNGYPIDADTGQLVNVGFDSQGNAIDLNTNEIIANVTLPDQQTTYIQPTQGTWTQVAQQAVLQLTTPSSPNYNPYYAQSYGTSYPYGSYGAPAPYGGTLGSQYHSGVSTSVSASRSGIGGSLNISPTILLIGAVALLAFFGGKRGR